MVRRSLLWVLTLAAVPSLSANLPATGGERQRPDADGVRLLSGRVTVPGGGPLLRVRVDVERNGVPEREPAFTDRDGLFRIAVPITNSWNLKIAKPGFVALRLNASEIASARPADSIELAVTMERGAAAVGEVLSESGEPIVGAMVRVRYRNRGRSTTPGPGERTTDTDDRGVFRIGSLPPGDVEVTVLPPDDTAIFMDPTGLELPQPEVTLNATPVQATLYAGRETTVVVRVEQRLSLPAPRRSAESASIDGRVLAPDGRPVPDALIQAIPLGGIAVIAALTDARGSYSVSGLAAGRFRVRISKPGFAAIEYGQSRALQPGRILSVRERERVQNINVTLTRGAVLTGRMVDAQGEPIEGLLVQAWEARFCGERVTVSGSASGPADRYTDDRGEYRLYGVLPAS